MLWSGIPEERARVYIDRLIQSDYLVIVSGTDNDIQSEINANLVDNTDIVANAYLATILWRGVERNIAVLAMGRRPLVGTALLEDYHLSIDFVRVAQF